MATYREAAELWKREAGRLRRTLGEVAEQCRRAEQRRDEARAAVRLATTARDDVWLWQGDGDDDVGSLACPVVMEAETLRKIVRERDKLSSRLATARHAAQQHVDAPTRCHEKEAMDRLYEAIGHP